MGEAAVGRAEPLEVAGEGAVVEEPYPEAESRQRRHREDAAARGGAEPKEEASGEPEVAVRRVGWAARAREDPRRHGPIP